ncbi:helix-turn-helix domain-containing protein [Williamsia sp. 1135]|uniref:helix-turn-helix transcriptional regulator n=1 Tax=Williamsia sp. 1135 TaxID=1889262 RepID=UPI001439AFC1|nr:helix-turn-helix domain-containing protein [Williamsia sp. 1135]
MNQTFGDVLREHRTRIGLSQRALAEKLQALGIGVDQAAITRMETGQREPKLVEAMQIADFLHFDISMVSYGPDEKISNQGWQELATATYYDAREAVSQYLEALFMAIGTWAPNEDEDEKTRAEFAAYFLEYISSLPGREEQMARKPAYWRWDYNAAFDVSAFLDALVIGLEPKPSDDPET